MDLYSSYKKSKNIYFIKSWHICLGTRRTGVQTPFDPGLPQKILYDFMPGSY